MREPLSSRVEDQPRKKSRTDEDGEEKSPFPVEGKSENSQRSRIASRGDGTNVAGCTRVLPSDPRANFRRKPTPPSAKERRASPAPRQEENSGKRAADGRQTRKSKKTARERQREVGGDRPATQRNGNVSRSFACGTRTGAKAPTTGTPTGAFEGGARGGSRRAQPKSILPPFARLAIFLTCPPPRRRRKRRNFPSSRAGTQFPLPRRRRTGSVGATDKIPEDSPDFVSTRSAVLNFGTRPRPRPQSTFRFGAGAFFKVLSLKEKEGATSDLYTPRKITERMSGIAFFAPPLPRRKSRELTR